MAKSNSVKPGFGKPPSTGAGNGKDGDDHKEPEHKPPAYRTPPPKEPEHKPPAFRTDQPQPPKSEPEKKKPEPKKDAGRESQSELAMIYQQEQQRPTWQRFLFGPSVAKDPATGQYYPVVTTEPPFAPAPGRGVRHAAKLLKFTPKELKKLRDFKATFELKGLKPSPRDTAIQKSIKISQQNRQAALDRLKELGKSEPKLMVAGNPVPLSDIIEKLKPDQEVEITSEKKPKLEPGKVVIGAPEWVMPILDPSMAPLPQKTGKTKPQRKVEATAPKMQPAPKQVKAPQPKGTAKKAEKAEAAVPAPRLAPSPAKAPVKATTSAAPPDKATTGKGAMPPKLTPKMITPMRPVVIRSKGLPYSPDWTSKQINSAVAWKQGLFYIAGKAPYGKGDWAYFKKPPRGMTVVKDSSKAAKTIQTLSGKPPPNLIFRFGIMRALIRRPARAPGKPGALTFEKRNGSRAKGLLSRKPIINRGGVLMRK